MGTFGQCKKTDGTNLAGAQNHGGQTMTTGEECQAACGDRSGVRGCQWKETNKRCKSFTEEVKAIGSDAKWKCWKTPPGV